MQAADGTGVVRQCASANRHTQATALYAAAACAGQCSCSISPFHFFATIFPPKQCASAHITLTVFRQAPLCCAKGKGNMADKSFCTTCSCNSTLAKAFLHPHLRMHVSHPHLHACCRSAHFTEQACQAHTASAIHGACVCLGYSASALDRLFCLDPSARESLQAAICSKQVGTVGRPDLQTGTCKMALFHQASCANCLLVQGKVRVISWYLPGQGQLS